MCTGYLVGTRCKLVVSITVLKYSVVTFEPGCYRFLCHVGACRLPRFLGPSSQLGQKGVVRGLFLTLWPSYSTLPHLMLWCYIHNTRNWFNYHPRLTYLQIGVTLPGSLGGIREWVVKIKGANPKGEAPWGMTHAVPLSQPREVGTPKAYTAFTLPRSFGYVPLNDWPWYFNGCTRKIYIANANNLLQRDAQIYP